MFRGLRNWGLVILRNGLFNSVMECVIHNEETGVIVRGQQWSGERGERRERPYIDLIIIGSEW